MKIVTSNIEQFKIFFDTIYDVASEDIELKFFMDKLTCSILDGSHTRFFYVEYEMKFFDEYDVDEVASICVSVTDLYNLLKLANKSDTLTLQFSEEIMSAELLSKNGTKRLFEFVLPYGFVDSPNMPSIQLPGHIEVETSDLKQSVKDISLIGTNIFQFVLSEGTITLMSDTMMDTSSYSSTKYAQVIEAETGVADVMTVRFNLEFINQMLKFDKINKVISIDLGEKALVYKFEDEIMGVTVHGLIAPRIVEEE